MKYTFFWAVVALLTEVHCQQFTEVVPTDNGAVRGRILKTVLNSIRYSVFKGIPFAKPPVGDLRFRDPVKAEPWTGVLNATEDSPICVQYFDATPGSEDCLYLNVFTPVLNFTKMEKPLPVMIWIYGGAFLAGSVTTEKFGPDFFLENNVVFVDMNYRLGPLGLMALNMDECRGNQALKDQIMAMQWVQNNIAKFGGDPNQVTLFGESAGAISVMYHLKSPQSKGLFQRAISQSGTTICPWGFNTPEQTTQAAYDLAAQMGIAAETNEQLLDALKKADIKDIVNSMRVIVGRQFPFSLPFNPTIDAIHSDPSPENVFLDDCPISKLQSGNYTRVPIMIGYNKDEMAVGPLGSVPAVLRNDMIKRLNKLFSSDTTGRSKDFTSILNTIANGTDSDLTKIATAFYLTGPIDSTQKMLAKYNGKIPVYYYRLSYSNKRLGHNETAHGYDIPLLFCNDTALHLDPNSEYNMYRKQLVSLWTNFAKYGNPTPHGDPIKGGVWLPSGTEGRQIDLGNEEFKIHDRLLDPRDQDFGKFYTFILPNVTACANHA